MIATGETSRSALTDNFAALHRLPFLDADLAQMAINRLQAEAMVEAGMKPVVTLPDGEEIYDPDDVKGEN